MARKNREESQSLELHRGREVSRWDQPWPASGPFSMMRRIFGDMDRIMDRFFEDFTVPSVAGSRSWTSDRFSPDIDVFERDGKLVISADLPGLTKDDVKVDVTESAVIIEGKRKYEHEEREEGVYRSERGYGQFHREIPLPERVKTETAAANFKNGVLEIAMEAPQLSKARRRIQIQSGDTGPKAA